MSHLNIEAIVEGMIACASNAKKLAADARRLYGLHRYSTAGALAIASLEESGKLVLLLRAGIKLARGQQPDWENFWKNWKSHDLKEKAATFFDLIEHGRNAANLAIRTFVFEDIVKLRERFLYVDRERNQWIEPKSTDHYWVIELLDAAEALSEVFFTEANIRRKKILFKELQKAAKDITVEKTFLLNYIEGIMEVGRRITKVNVEFNRSCLGYAA